MAKKIKIITDSGSDMPQEYEKKHDIRILCFPMSVGKKEFRDRDLSNMEFYDLILNSADFPASSMITSFEFEGVFKEYFMAGFDELIYISIASKGSNTYSAAVMAKSNFYEAFPEAAGKVQIHIVDSGNYTGVYGYPTVQAAIKAAKGVSSQEIIAYLEDWFSAAQVVFGCYSLQFAKRSGRISAATAFMGEMLGLRPIIKIRQGVSSTIAKVRGDKNVIPKLVEMISETIIPQSPYSVVYGIDPDLESEFAAEMTKKLGYPPEMKFQVGAAVASNSGPLVVGAIYKTK